MPHKHKRKRGGAEAEFDLPPTQTARPLPVGKGKQKPSIEPESRPIKKQWKSIAKHDDAPRAFRRLMAVAQGKTMRSGLDDGTGGKTVKTAIASHDVPRIQPGEDLRTFSARVDASISVLGLTRKLKTKNGKDELGMRIYRTRKERQMHRLYDQWRDEERNIQEQREEELERVAEQDLENDAAGILTSKAFANDNGNPSGKSSKTKKKGKGRGDNRPGDEDPWHALKMKRDEVKIGLHDVAQAPPELHRKTAKLLYIGGAAVDVDNIPKAAGSLRRREELQAARTAVVAIYRKIRKHD